MAEQNDPVMAEVMALLETEPTNAPASVSDIPAQSEQLAILVNTGKCKKAIGVKLTQDQVSRLDDKDVRKYIERYKTYVGAKTTETLIDSFLTFSIKALGLVVKIKDTAALKNELKNDYIITKEMSDLTGGLALRCGRLLSVANAFLITAMHVDFTPEEATITEKSSVITEESEITTE